MYHDQTRRLITHTGDDDESSSSSYSTPSYSPLPSDQCVTSSSTDSSEIDMSSFTQSEFGEVGNTVQQGAITSQSSQLGTTTCVSDNAERTLEQINNNGFKLCGDNVDKTVRERYMRINSGGVLSLHYFHIYGVLDRVNFSHLSPHMCQSLPQNSSDAMASILPTPEDDSKLRDNFIILITRIIVNHIDVFKFSFEDVVSKHIEHEYSREMALKSQVVRY